MRHKLLTVLVTMAVVQGLALNAYAADRGKGPVLHLRFDEGGGATAYDDGWTDTDSDGIKDSGESWNNYDGTLVPGDNTGSNDTVGEMWTTQGKIGNALECDGTNDHVTATDTTCLRQGNDWTISGWIKLLSSDPGPGNDRIVIGKTGWHGGLTRLSGGNIRFNIFNTLGTNVAVSYTATQDVWYHYAAVYTSSSGGMNFYVNGASVGTNTFNTANTMNYEGSSTLYIGGSGSDSGYHSYQLTDDVKIYDYARTAAQIAVDYNAGAAARLGAGTDPNEGNPPVGYWKFDENTGTTVYDHSGNGNDGTFVNSPSWVQGKHGTALDFNGSNEYINCGNGSSIDMTTNDFTVEAWMYLTKMNVGILSKNAWQNGNYSIGFDDNQDNIYAHCIDQSGIQVHTDGKANVSPSYYNKWTHIAFVADRSGTGLGHLYINGQEVSSYTRQESFSGVGSLSNTEPLYIGRFGSWYWDDKLDEVKIYNYARTAAQVAYDYNKGAPVAHYRFDEGTGTIAHNSESSADSGAAPVGWWRMDEGTGGTTSDSSGNGNTATLYPQTLGTNTTTAMMWDQTGKIGPDCLEFDGTDDYISITSNSALNLSGGGTVSVWVKIPSTWTGSTYPNMVGKGANAGWDTDGWALHAFSSNSTGIGMRNGATTFNLTFTNAIKDAWTHITGTWDGSTVKIYQDGVLKNSTSQTINPPTTSTALTIGRDAGSQYFGGQIDDVRIYNYARTAEQIYNDYKSTHATLYNGAKFVDGKIGKALSLDGTNDYALIEAPDYLFGSGDFSVGLWAKPTVLDASYDGLISTDVAGDAAWKIFRNTGDSYFQAKYGTTNVSYSAVSAGDWHHYGYVKSGTDLILYLDGKYLSTTACPATHSVSGTKVVLGSYRVNDALSGWHIFNGLIDDVCIYNYARTAAQVTEDYAVSASRHGAKRTGVADPWDGAMPVGHWKMDENTGVLARDASENANDGRIYGSTWTQGKKGPCLNFDGTASSYVIKNPISNFPTSEVSVAFWMKTSASDNRHPFSYASTASDNEFLFNYNCQNILIGGVQYSTSVTYNDGNWHYVVATWKSSDGAIRVYKDGILVSSGTHKQGYALTAGGSLVLGQDQDSVGGGFDGNQAFNGLIDDVCVYNYILTQAQVAWLYNRGAPVARWRFDEATSGAVSTSAGAIKDDSGNDYDGTASNTTWSYTTGKFGGALIFDNNDYVQGSTYFPCLGGETTGSSTQQFTVSAWIYPQYYAGEGIYYIFGNEQGYGTGDGGFGYGLYINDGSTFTLAGNFGDGNYGGAPTWHYATQGEIGNYPYDQWYHYAIVYSPTSSIKYYVNGALVYTKSIASDSYYYKGTNYRIGRYPISNDDRFFKGKLDDLRFYNYARTAEQIKQDYNAGAASRLGD